MNNLIDQIDAYLDGTMSAEESASFETKMNSDASLLEQVNTQRNLRAGIERIGMKAATAQSFKKITLKNKLYKWGVATIAVAAIATSAYLATTSSSSTDGPEITYELHDTNEEGGTEWSDADRNLPTQLFTINPAKDTVIETMGGLVFAIPAGAFLDAKDPFTLEIREALTPMDIMKGGLSTTSNGELLETGGMFYLNARNGETSLKINPDKPVYANVPTNEIRPGMQLFEGERTADGGINWVNPKPMEKQLIPVDIFSLNFYPDGFLEKVAELGFDANDRRVTDSIYYSYAGRKQETDVERDYTKELGSKDSLLIRFILISHKGAIGAGPGVNRSRQDADHVADNVMNLANGTDFAKLIEEYSDQIVYQGVEKGKKFWLHKTTVMYPEVAQQILNNGMWDRMKFYTDKGWYIVENLTYKKTQSETLEIDPSRIKAIVDEKFQNTILATKEFEERLQEIFIQGTPEALDLYVNNLDKKLYEIDSMAAILFEGSRFNEFYLRHDGGVAISQSHMKELQEYYQKKQEAVRIASQKTYDARTAEQRKQDSIYFDKTTEYWKNSAGQEGDNFKEEFVINLKEAYRQLGIEAIVSPAPNYYSFEVNNPGWKNVDAYVLYSTATRTTLDYTDPLTGKKAVIKYEELKVNVIDAANYSQLMIYLVTDSLPCFQKVYDKGEGYAENLNELFEYSLVVIGEKDGIWFSAMTPKVTPSSVNVTLNSTDEASLRNTLNSTFSGKVGSDFGAEVSFMKEMHSYDVLKEKERRQDEIDRQIMQVIFPFYTLYDPGFDDGEMWGYQ